MKSRTFSIKLGESSLMSLQHNVHFYRKKLHRIYYLLAKIYETSQLPNKHTIITITINQFLTEFFGS